MLYVISFIFGIFLGSFLNVLIDRLSTDRPFVKGRSYCEHCKKTLHPKDLMPLVSFLLLKGRCRYCRKSIPVRLFVVELVTGLVAVFSMFVYLSGMSPLFVSVVLFVILFSFLGIFFADLYYGIIPDLLVLLSLIAAFLYIMLLGLPLQAHLFAAGASLLFFVFLFIITKGKGMGLGDVKLSFVLGLLLGFPNIVVGLYLAFLTGAGVSIILVICRKLRFFGGTIPFGPFLIASSVITLFYGKDILNAFVQNFL